MIGYIVGVVAIVLSSFTDCCCVVRYTIGPVYRESKVLGSHPREIHECTFDIVSPSPSRFAPQYLFSWSLKP